MKTAIVYDRVNKWGGAERVLLSLHNLFPEAPLYTSVYNLQKAKWADKFSVKTSFLKLFPGAKSAHEFYAPVMPIAFEQFNFDKYDLVISVTSEAAKGVITKPGTKHICYMLTPTRYLWSGYEEYFQNRLFRSLTKPIVSYLRSWDKMAAQRPDSIISISHEVRSRVKTYYNRDSEVIYPAISLPNLKTQQVSNDNYFLIVSRLVSYKKIDLAINSFNLLKLPLIIIGTGMEEQKLKKMAGSTITFLGQVSDTELAYYYAHCQALIFPGHEDFGLAVVEAQLSGKPVIAYKKGGALETILEGKTGEFFAQQSVASLVETLTRFQHNKYNKNEIVANAKKFSEDRFKKQFLDAVNKLVL